MTTNAARHGARIVLGLPLLSALAALAAIGCGAEASTDPSTDTQAEELRHGHGHHLGPKLCRTADGSECEGDDLCLPLLSRACPGPKHVGICVPKPRACPDVTDPVCGCDGTTYDNLCEAAAARTAIDHMGACVPSGSGCGNGAACPGAGVCVGAPGNSGDSNHHMCSFGHHHSPPPSSGGTCECNVIEQCPRGQTFDNSAAVCACVDGQTADPCARVTCPTGTACVVQSDGTVACQ